MSRSRTNALGRVLRRNLSFGGTVLASVVATLLVLRVLSPSGARAQVSQAPPPASVRASEFLLVGNDGTTRARLGFDNDGAVLSFYDADGQTARLKLGDTSAGQGLVVLDTDGATNKVTLGTSGAGDTPGVAVFDAGGNERVAMGIGAGGGSGMWVNYADGITPHVQVGATASDDTAGARVLDSAGNTTAIFP
jgi:hypothetical protein